MSSKRILVIVHETLVPPEGATLAETDDGWVPWITEFDVIDNLRKLGYKVFVQGIYNDLSLIKKAIEKHNPHLVYNLLEEFDGEALFDQNVVSYLELLRVPYTGCNPRGLMLGRDKALSKKILSYHKIKTPKFHVYLKSKRFKIPKNVHYPVIVKCLMEEASYALSQASVVSSDEKLEERVQYINRNLGLDAIAEQFIEGNEYFVSVIGNSKLTCYPTRQLVFTKAENPEKEFYSKSAKFNEGYRERKGIDTCQAQITPELEERLHKIAKKTYKVLNLNGYARIDFRVTQDEVIYVLEANPNPDISEHDDFASSALAAKIKYRQLLKKIINLGISWYRASS